MTQNCSCHGEGGKYAKAFVGDIERPRYSPGLILEDSDLTSAVDYTRSLNQLLFRSLFGCGVICGLTISIDANCGLTIRVAPGLGLDGCGNPVQLTRTAEFALGKRDGVPVDEESRQKGPDKRDFWIVACAGEKLCEPRALVCDGDDFDGGRQATRVRSTVEISLTTTPPDCLCGCAPGTESWPTERSALNDRALALLGMDPTGTDPCQHDHETRIACATDCGCGSACSCGCCILLGWVHWLEQDQDGGTNAGWVVLHNGVRRFIRPGLLPDPARETDLGLNQSALGTRYERLTDMKRARVEAYADREKLVVERADAAEDAAKRAQALLIEANEKVAAITLDTSKVRDRLELLEKVPRTKPVTKPD